MSGKKYDDAVKRYDRDQVFSPTEALSLVKSMAPAKFDETIDIVIRLGVDPRKAEQAVRGTVALPSGTGKNIRVAVFAAGEAAEEARRAGADLVGADDLAAEIEKGNFDFDLAIATPDMMPLVGRLGRTLGPRGLMPNPKTGTVTNDVKTAINETKAGKVEFRVDKTGVIHAPLGKVSFGADKLVENANSLIGAVLKAKPSAAKGKYVRSCTICATMTPGVPIDTADMNLVRVAS